RRAVDEVPGAQPPLLALDQQQALAAQDQEVLLATLSVVVAVRLSRPQHLDVDAEVREAGPALERDAGAEPLVVHPLGLAGVEDEPALAGRLAAAGQGRRRGFGHHRVTIASPGLCGGLSVASRKSVGITPPRTR